VTYQVDPRPSALAVSPNSFSFTISQSSGLGPFVQLGSASVTATGDAQLGNIAFGPSFGIVPGISWGVGCTGVTFATPCSLGLYLQGAASNLSVGSYSGFFQVKSFIAGQTATVTVQLKVIP